MGKRGSKAQGTSSKPRLLMIVESPTKARTITRLLGGQVAVLPSFGHVRDLPENAFGIDVEKDFAPRYVVVRGKEKVLKELKRAAGDYEQVVIATDEDREGEAIAWHLAVLLGLSPQEKIRAAFHEITRSALQQALENLRPIDMNLVESQVARRLLDRIVGYRLSPLLWKKVRGGTGLSAGRVQSVAVRLLVEREREISAFRSESYFSVNAVFDIGGERFKAHLSSHLTDEHEAEKLLRALASARFTVKKVEKKRHTQSPPPPFTTTTLQQEAQRRFGFSVSKTMMVAQMLYEKGYITYMRTDSVHLAPEAIEMAKKEIVKRFGASYSQPRQYTTKVKLAQEAHEAIRPTSFSRTGISESPDEQRLYTLIWTRALASQMADAVIQRTTVEVSARLDTEEEVLFVARGRVIEFDGYLRLYNDSEESEEKHFQQQLPALQEGDLLTIVQAQARQRWTSPPSRYTEASLVRKLEQMGIGRPSTYATIVNTIIKRGYTERRSVVGSVKRGVLLELNIAAGTVNRTEFDERVGAERNRLIPTPLAFSVTDYLVAHFPDIMDYEFTARMEDQLDAIARGEITRLAVLRSFYWTFEKLINEALADNSPRLLVERHLGTLPDGRALVATKTRYGPALKVVAEDGSDAQYLSIPPPYSLTTITEEQAHRLLALPLTIGDIDGMPVELRLGKWGLYLFWNGVSVSLRNHRDPLSVSIDEAQKLLLWKVKTQQAKNQNKR